MNRGEYINILRSELSVFPYEEREAAIAYYNEFFDEAGEDNEQAVIASLGDPSKLAKTIISEGSNSSEEKSEGSTQNTVFTPPQTNKKESFKTDSSRTALIVILVIITFPFWIGAVAGIFGLLFGLIVAMIGITIAFCSVAVVAFGIGVAQLFISPALGILLMGIGLIAGGICILAVFPLIKVLFKGFSSAIKGVCMFFRNIFGTKGVEA